MSASLAHQSISYAEYLLRSAVELRTTGSDLFAMRAQVLSRRSRGAANASASAPEDRSTSSHAYRLICNRIRSDYEEVQLLCGAEVKARVVRAYGFRNINAIVSKLKVCTLRVIGM